MWMLIGKEAYKMAENVEGGKMTKMEKYKHLEAQVQEETRA